VELLRGVADLGAHPELPAVGEAGRGVDVNARGVDAEAEGGRRFGVARDDRLGVPAAVKGDVLEGVRERVDDADREDRGQVLGREVLFGGWLDAGAVELLRVQLRDAPRRSRPARVSARAPGGPRPSTAAELAGHLLVDEQRLGGVAHARALDLRVQRDRVRLLEVGGGVDVDVAVADAA
jgi:hypothetical protein